MSSDSTTGPNRSANVAAIPVDWVVPGSADAEGEAGEGGRVVELTEAAQEEVRRLLVTEGKPGLRLGIKGGGCSGLSYLLEFTDVQEGDTVLDFGDFKVFLDRKSTIYLRGITLDHQSGLDGRGFVFQNPQAANTCGCGESFSL